MLGTDEVSNLVKLTAREHFVCHLLLAKMTKHTENHSKMVYALNRMANATNSEHRYKITNRRYSCIREDFADARRTWFDDEDNRRQHGERIKEAKDSVCPHKEEIRRDKIRNHHKQEAADSPRRKRISDAHKGRKKTGERLNQILTAGQRGADSRRGKPWTPARRAAYDARKPVQPAEANERRSVALKGRKTSSGMKGRHHSEETKKKMSIAIKKALAERRNDTQETT